MDRAEKGRVWRKSKKQIKRILRAKNIFLKKYLLTLIWGKQKRGTKASEHLIDTVGILTVGEDAHTLPSKKIMITLYKTKSKQLDSK